MNGEKVIIIRTNGIFTPVAKMTYKEFLHNTFNLEKGVNVIGYNARHEHIVDEMVKDIQDRYDSIIITDRNQELEKDCLMIIPSFNHLCAGQSEYTKYLSELIPYNTLIFVAMYQSPTFNGKRTMKYMGGNKILYTALSARQIVEVTDGYESKYVLKTDKCRDGNLEPIPIDHLHKRLHREKRLDYLLGK